MLLIIKQHDKLLALTREEVSAVRKVMHLTTRNEKKPYL